jgi:hypothetical protein
VRAYPEYVPSLVLGRSLEGLGKVGISPELTALLDAETIVEVFNTKPKLKFNKRGELIPYEFDRGLYLLDVKGIRGSVKGLSEGDEDLLVSNFWALLLGTLRDLNPSDVVDVGGTAYILRTQTDVSAGSAYLGFGVGTDPEYFTQYNLVSYKASITTTISRAYMSDRNRVSLSGTLTGDAYELAIFQSLYDSGGTARTVMLGRRTGTWYSGQAVVWNIDFLQPWVRSVADVLYGIFLNANVTMVDVTGASFTARTSGDFQPASVWLVASPNVVTWSPDLTSIPNKVDLTTYYADFLGSRVARMTYLTGTFTPLADTQYNTIGLYQGIFDTAGTTHYCCMMVIPLSAPITFYSNRNNLAILRIIVM